MRDVGKREKIFHIRTVHLDIIKVLFVHQMIH